MLEFAPSTFAEGGELESIRQAVKEHGLEKLGKAERYLFELSQVPRVEPMLRVFQLLLSVDDIKNQTVQSVAVLRSISREVAINLCCGLCYLHFRCAGALNCEHFSRQCYQLGIFWMKAQRRGENANDASHCKNGAVMLLDSKLVHCRSWIKRSQIMERLFWSTSFKD